MGFMSAYKHLDTICRDMNGVGVSGYLGDMEREAQGAYRVQGWSSDYQKLKHYRWVRNQIAHEMYAEEENMCTPEDTRWLEDFYGRILNRSDPLAAYASMKRAEAVRHPVPRTAQDDHNRECKLPVKDRPHPENGPSPQRSGSLVFAILAVLVLMIWLLSSGT